MPIVRPFDASELMAETTFGYFAADTERGQMRARCPAQIVKGEVP
jgi:hypothetical protein